MHEQILPRAPGTRAWVPHWWPVAGSDRDGYLGRLGVLTLTFVVNVGMRWILLKRVTENSLGNNLTVWRILYKQRQFVDFPWG